MFLQIGFNLFRQEKILTITVVSSVCNRLNNTSNQQILAEFLRLGGMHMVNWALVTLRPETDLLKLLHLRTTVSKYLPDIGIHFLLAVVINVFDFNSRFVMFKFF